MLCSPIHGLLQLYCASMNVSEAQRRMKAVPSKLSSRKTAQKCDAVGIHKHDVLRQLVAISMEAITQRNTK